MDPLAALPAEIVLRILEFASIDSIAALIGANSSWQAFIELHEDAIYAPKIADVKPGDTPHDYMKALKAFRPDLLSGVRNWKDVCRRRRLLTKAWESPKPVATIFQIGTNPVWRFKIEFDSRFIVSTSQAGGINVTDMDTGDLLWSLGRHEVRPFAHLEYENGTAVWVGIAPVGMSWLGRPFHVRKSLKNLRLDLPYSITPRGMTACGETSVGVHLVRTSC